MTYRDETTADLAVQCIRLAEDVIVWPVRERGELSYRLEIPSLHRFYRVGYEEYLLISLLDGKTTPAQACGLVAAKVGRRAPSGKQAEAIGRWLLKNELAYLPEQGPPVRRPGATTAQQESGLQWLQRLNPFWIKWPLRRTSQIIKPMADNFRWCLSPASIAIALVLISIAGFTLIREWGRFTDDSLRVLSPSNFVWLFVTWLLLKLVHETAHAVACHRYGGKVHEAGVVFVLFAPLAYVDVTSCWRMNSRFHRIAVAGAGMFAEIVLASVAVLVWRLTTSPEIALLMKNIVVTASVTTIAFNANVLMRFDGYYILADLIEVSNLYAESMSSVKRMAVRWIVGNDTEGGSLVGWRRGFVLAYGCAALVWKVTICFTLGVAASTLFSGAGIVLTALGVVLWFAGPLVQLYRFAGELFDSDRATFARAASVSLGLTALVVFLVAWLPIPTSVTVAAVADFPPETRVRSSVDGFVRQIHVDNMSTVKPGDLLMELENRELDDRQRGLEIELAQNEIRKRQAAGKHDAAAAAVLREKHLALKQQLAHIDSQRAGLRVIAHRSGQVICRDLSHKIGTHVSEGDHLMYIAKPSEKELMAMVSQSQIRRARKSTNRTVTLVAADFTGHQGTLDRIDPRATDQLPNPSLAANAGGPLAVQRNENEAGQVRLVEPHFLARISLGTESAEATPAGMRLQTSFGYRTDPLLARLRIKMSDLIYRAQDER